jgi:hypothetical protein
MGQSLLDKRKYIKQESTRKTSAIGSSKWDKKNEEVSRLLMA